MEKVRLQLLDVPNRIDDEDCLAGVPHSADEANIDHRRDGERSHMFVKWPALAGDGRRVVVRIGVEGINVARINATLKANRQSIQEAADAALQPGKTEVTLDNEF